MNKPTSIGLDVHARTIHAGILNTTTGELTHHILADAANTTVIAFIRDHISDPSTVQVVYEAGPTGYHLARALNTAGIACDILAPSKLPRPSGDHIKTDKRDAMFLARVAAMGEYAIVRVPTLDEEAARDLIRGRDDVRIELMAQRHRLSKLLLRNGLIYPGKTTWGREHDAWLRHIRKDGLDGAGAGTLAAYDDVYEAVSVTSLRKDRLDAAITAMAAASPFTDTTNRLCCLRGISTLTGFGFAVEVGDFTRFTPISIGAFLGLVPSEHSSGQSRAQGGITRAGNTHARRLLVESAWHHATDYHPGATLTARWTKAPRAVALHADKGNRRLHARWVNLSSRHKPGATKVAAVARELASWCQVLATMDA